MKNISLLVALAAFAYAAVPASASADARLDKCQARGSVTLTGTSYVRVYALPSRNYVRFACYKPTGSTRTLGDYEWVGPIAAAGRFVAWDRTACDSHDHCVSDGVRVLDMRTRELRRERLPREDGSYAMRVIVTPKGSAAWLRLEDFDRTGVQVRRLVGRRQKTLDSSCAITRDYLELGRDEARRLIVRWKNAGTLKSAPIP